MKEVKRKAIRYSKRVMVAQKKAAVFLVFLTGGFVLLGLLIFVRSKTIPNIHMHPFLFSYSIFVFAFLVGRIISSLFYRQSMKTLLSAPEVKEYEPSITFVVPCKNEEQVIAHTVEACLTAEYPKEKLEVIVINDGSTDHTGEVLTSLAKKYPELVVVDWVVNRGKREGMAEGFRRAKGEIIIQIDSDSYIEPHTVRHMVEPFANEDIGAVCGHADVANANENFITKMQSTYYYISFRVMKAAESVFFSVFCCSGCSSAYRKSAVMPILDLWLTESFLGKRVTYGDDRSLTTWVLKEGWQTVYTDKVKAYTIVPSTIKQLFKQQLRWKKSWIINGIFTTKFLIKKDTFTAFFYFIPLLLISFVTPFVGLWNVYLLPLVFGRTTLYYLAGIVLMALMLMLYYRILKKNSRNWPYLLLWQFFNTFFMSYVIFYAVFKLRDRGWGTR